MFKFEKKSYGFKLTLAGMIQPGEMQDWVAEAKNALAGVTNVKGVFVDMRELKPLPAESKQHMEAGQKMFKEKGMERSVVIVASATLKMQFKRIGKETGIYEWERYIDASTIDNWEQMGEAWIKNGVDPDML